MANTPPAGTPKPGLLDRLKTLLPGGEGSAPHPRWPHRTKGWLDPNVPLHGWRNRVDREDAAEALRAIADRSEGRIDAAGVAEILDAMADEKEAKEPMSFRFGASDAFRQLWIGVAPEETGGVRLFLLSDLSHTERVEAALSVAGFHHPEKRAEYDRLGRFLVAIWEWRGTAAPPSLHVEGHDAAVIAARLKRTVTDPQSPALEVLRGLRMRARDMVAELARVEGDVLVAADAWLAAQHAPTLSEMRKGFGK